ncbi:MAG: folate-binding protein YgfZ [Silicimonas sp.]|nr:folate-binding protein YgfZ [Silicimonas sp.]
MSTRTVFRITGSDRETFLQNLVTNDVARAKEGLVWTALLTPQGKYLADFFLLAEGDALLLDVDTGLAAGLAQRLTMYRLRADVKLEETKIAVARGTDETPKGAFPDPRDPSLGWRAYDGRSGEEADWDALRVAAGVPESGIELQPNESYPLEQRFEALNGVDFKKGCYVGQEVTARMKHKTELRKGLAKVRVQGAADPGTPILTADGKEAGTLYTQAGGAGLAYLRFDRATGTLSAGDAKVTFEGSS